MVVGFVSLAVPLKANPFLLKKHSVPNYIVFTRKTKKVSVRQVKASSYGMNGSSKFSLGGARYKASAVSNDGRCFKITYCQPSQSRGFSGRELQNVYTTKLVPFSSWYAEQQRIMKMGGKIYKVELAVGKKQQNVGNM
eukprot:jgi/Galph1/5002/GphlegSOOS_G3684.1